MEGGEGGREGGREGGTYLESTQGVASDHVHSSIHRQVFRGGRIV